MSEPIIDIIHFLIFIVPGAIAVWSFRHFTKSNKQGDFEYLTLSAFWGVIILAIQSLIVSTSELNKLLSNPYAATMVLSLFGFFGGWLASKIAKLLR